ncbi:hypothetical protein CTA2_7052 [Colletotrichum tanaceti]|uniref:Heterokaryon incompatibility domain-containing protein n=1 Tax=Colletotrichum tanaceti TaxID=1306861 RepID=A0A4U6XKL2_9PEZI|nr:hypothetical protein CTA2_7052 [Colletotrichum tanaceti]TKW55627.1 hypothetical protein CTA1_13300 [Colletotrichum tanaceti]
MSKMGSINVAKVAEKPCDLCSDLINSIVHSTILEGNRKCNTWHRNTREISDSAASCRSCTAILVTLLEPTILEASERFSDITRESSMPVSVSTSSLDVIDNVGWASLNLVLDIDRHSFEYRVDGNLGVSVQHVSSTHDHRHSHPRFWTSGKTHEVGTLAEDRILCTKTWLDFCETSHGNECRPSERRLPKRLLDTRPTHPLRLVASEDIERRGERVRYATLSYSWGASLPFKTTTASETDHVVGIREDLLPRTFRHAIKLVRALAIPYLWIDSLCIVQDDPLEWQSEASYMEDYYSGSTLTVAATDALDSNGGCFPEDDDGIELPGPASCRTDRSKVPFQSGPSTSEERQYRPSNPNVQVFSYNCQIGDTNTVGNVMVRLQYSHPRSIRRRAHLSTRGWVLQEQVLSHRTVHCMKSETYWECRCILATQSNQRYGPVRGSDVGHSEHSKAHFTSMWPEWVEDYSRRDFTMPSDRLRAFAGISSYYQRNTIQEPILGLTPRAFARDLSWARAGPNRGPGVSGAPSWTWFSCHAPVWVDHWGCGDGDEIQTKDWTSLVSFRIRWKGSRMTSDIASCTLVVRGPMKEFALCTAPESKGYNPPYLLVDGQRTDFATSRVPWDCPGQFDQDDYPSCVKATYTCLLLRSKIARRRRDSNREVFLILRREAASSLTVDGTDYPVFRRVGIASMRGNERRFVHGAEEATIILH